MERSFVEVELFGTKPIDGTHSSIYHRQEIQQKLISILSLTTQLNSTHLIHSTN
jgi:hypothetical protein